MALAESIRNSAEDKAYLEVHRPDLCQRYSQKLAELPATITPASLEGYVSALFCYPYLEAFHTLRPVVFAPDKQLTENKLARIKRVLASADEGRVLRESMSLRLPEGYSYLRILPGRDYKDIFKMMNCIPNCIPPAEKEEVARLLQEDIDLGACIKLFGLNAAGEPQTYFRDYLSLGYNDELLLQIDSVEGGDEKFWTTVQQWIDAGRSQELIYGVAASLYLADRLGISKVVLGDFESDEIGKMIGCREVKVYGAEVRKRKIGLPPQTRVPSADLAPTAIISDGVFTNRLAKDSYQRVFDCSYLSLLQNLFREPETSVKMIADEKTIPKTGSRRKQEELDLYRLVVDRLLSKPLNISSPYQQE